MISFAPPLPPPSTTRSLLNNAWTILVSAMFVSSPREQHGGPTTLRNKSKSRVNTERQISTAQVAESPLPHWLQTNSAWFRISGASGNQEPKVLQPTNTNNGSSRYMIYCILTQKTHSHNASCLMAHLKNVHCK